MKAAAVRFRKVEPEHRRTGSKVRAGSRLDDGVRLDPLSWAEGDRRKKAFDRVAGEMRPPKGRRHGCEGTYSLHARRVFNLMVDLAVKHGAVTVAIDTIARMAGCCARTVNRVKEQLRASGWIEWIRRCEPTGMDGRRGPQVRQISNAYRLTVPTIAGKLLSAWKARWVAMRTSAAEEWERTQRDRERSRPDGRLGAALDELGAAVDRRGGEREGARGAESVVSGLS